ncbi:hypothetical protein C8R45DRAFT_982600 [Mycena sanguinolenta]|nr:hypothetical protein C8R45DRAFT_982600 [Mycena sanguinolenta]
MNTYAPKSSSSQEPHRHLRQDGELLSYACTRLPLRRPPDECMPDDVNTTAWPITLGGRCVHPSIHFGIWLQQRRRRHAREEGMAGTWGAALGGGIRSVSTWCVFASFFASSPWSSAFCVAGGLVSWRCWALCVPSLPQSCLPAHSPRFSLPRPFPVTPFPPHSLPLLSLASPPRRLPPTLALRSPSSPHPSYPSLFRPLLYSTIQNTADRTYIEETRTDTRRPSTSEA